MKYFCLFYFSSSLSHTIKLLVLEVMHPPKVYTNQYVTMATAAPTSIFLCMDWVNMFASDDRPGVFCRMQNAERAIWSAVSV